MQVQGEYMEWLCHELRGQLTTIDGFAQTLLNSYERLDTNKREASLRFIAEASLNLTRLLATHMPSGDVPRLVRNRVDVGEAVGAAFERIADSARNGMPRVAVTGDVLYASADRGRLERALAAVAAALKSAGPVKELSAAATSEGRMIELRVKGDACRPVEVSGADLTIATLLLRIQGGDLKVGDVTGRRFSFTMTLPKEAASPQGQSSNKETP